MGYASIIYKGQINKREKLHKIKASKANLPKKKSERPINIESYLTKQNNHITVIKLCW